jgi:hypothetical protein
MLPVHDREMLEQWWRVGRLPAWVTSVLALATAVTVLVVFLGEKDFVHYLGAKRFARWGGWQHGLSAGIAVMLAACWLPPWKLARSLRVALLFPVLYLVAIVAAWGLWCAMRQRWPELLAGDQVASRFPLAAVVVIAGSATFAVARLIVRRRRAEWLHATVMLALAHLLVAALWLPIVTHLWCEIWGVGETPRTLDWLLSPGLLALALAPPFAVATRFTTLAFRRPPSQRVDGSSIVVGVAAALLVAMFCRTSAGEWSTLAYTNFVHVILALAIIAAGALAALALGVRRRTHVGVARHGVIVREPDSDEPAASLEIASWLRGPRVVARSFQVLTGDGVLDVLEGAEIRVALPEISTMLPRGHAIEVLRAGDRVSVAGFVAPPGGDPFRRSAALVPGRHGVVVTRIPDESASFAALALALWRPAIAYLVVVTIAALPGLAAAWTTG